MSVQEVAIIEIHVAAGDAIAVDDPIITLESDKATMDVPAELAGTVTAISVAVGDTVSQGDVILSVEVAEGGRVGRRQQAGGKQNGLPAAQQQARRADGVPAQAQAEQG